jgi:hypothetical protein
MLLKYAIKVHKYAIKVSKYLLNIYKDLLNERRMIRSENKGKIGIYAWVYTFYTMYYFF